MQAGQHYNYQMTFSHTWHTVDAVKGGWIILQTGKATLAVCRYLPCIYGMIHMASQRDGSVFTRLGLSQFEAFYSSWLIWHKHKHSNHKVKLGYISFQVITRCPFWLTLTLDYLENYVVKLLHSIWAGSVGGTDSRNINLYLWKKISFFFFFYLTSKLEENACSDELWSWLLKFVLFALVA